MQDKQGEADFIVSCTSPALGSLFALLALPRSRDVDAGTEGKTKIIRVLRGGKTS